MIVSDGVASWSKSCETRSTAKRPNSERRLILCSRKSLIGQTNPDFSLTHHKRCSHPVTTTAVTWLFHHITVSCKQLNPTLATSLSGLKIGSSAICLSPSTVAATLQLISLSNQNAQAVLGASHRLSTTTKQRRASTGCRIQLAASRTS